MTLWLVQQRVGLLLNSWVALGWYLNYKVQVCCPADLIKKLGWAGIQSARSRKLFFGSAVRACWPHLKHSERCPFLSNVTDDLSCMQSYELFAGAAQSLLWMCENGNESSRDRRCAVHRIRRDKAFAGQIEDELKEYTKEGLPGLVVVAPFALGFISGLVGKQPVGRSQTLSCPLWLMKRILGLIGVGVRLPQHDLCSRKHLRPCRQSQRPGVYPHAKLVCQGVRISKSGECTNGYVLISESQAWGWSMWTDPSRFQGGDYVDLRTFGQILWTCNDGHSMMCTGDYTNDPQNSGPSSWYLLTCAQESTCMVPLSTSLSTILPPASSMEALAGSVSLHCFAILCCLWCCQTAHPCLDHHVLSAHIHRCACV